MRSHNMYLTNSDYYNHLHTNLGVLIDCGKIGLSKFETKDIKAKTNRYWELEVSSFKNYHFCISVPYAGKNLEWEIIFNPYDFSIVPDFNFNDNTFLPEANIDYITENIPSWYSWNLREPTALLSILNEFLDLYKKKQIEKLSNNYHYSGLWEQYQQLLTKLNLSPNDVEVQIDTNSYDTTGDFTSVGLLIALPIDFTPLPEYCLVENGVPQNPGEDMALLSLQVKKADNSQTKPTLFLTPRLEDIIGKVKLPKVCKSDTVFDYVQSVRTLIENQIQGVADQHKAKGNFISAIVNTFPNSVLEYDYRQFSKVCFLYQEGDFDCLVTIQLGPKFPYNERPKVQLQSIYCQSGKSCNQFVTFIYQPDSSAEQNAVSLRDLLRTEEVIEFRNHKH